MPWFFLLGGFNPGLAAKRHGAGTKVDVVPFHMSSEKRHKWLSQFKYPYAIKSGVFGRLENIAKSEEVTSATLEGRDIQIPLNLKEGESLFFASDILIEGDLVSVDLDGDIARQLSILAPNRLSGKPSFFNPEFDVETSAKWQLFLDEVRSFFKKENFIEVRTPTLVASPGLEPHLDPFETDWFLGSKKKNLYLPTSPEFHLKKMLSLGWQNIFEMKDCFRNGELGANHQPEFLMLEWYRSFNNLDVIIEDVKELFQKLLCKFEFAPQDFEVISMADLFKERLNFQLTPTTTQEELSVLARQNGCVIDISDTWDDIFFRIFLEKIESSLGMSGSLILKDYPPSQAALAKINEQGWADRFEFYWQGIELANAFHELTDPTEQRKRFEIDQEQKKLLGKKIIPVDPEFLEALDYGLPPSSGIALGLERLFMLLIGEKSLDGTRVFPIRQPEI